MKVYIAKHYWKNKESATWESHSKIDKEIFKYLKQNYHNFVQNRPLIIRERKHYIYLCYEDSVDIYKRSITNITFFISPSKISEQLCSKDYHDLELSVSNPQVKFLLKGLFVFVGILFLYNVFFNGEKVERQIDKNETSKEMITDVKKHPKVLEKEERKIEKKKISINTDDVNKSIKSFKKADNKETNNTEKEELNKNVEEELPDDRYRNLLRKGLKYKLDILQKTKQGISKIKSIKLLFNTEEVSKIQPYKIYKINTRIKKDSFFSKDKEIKKQFTINENELIKIFNGESIKREISDGYYLKLEKIKGENNESRTKE